MDFRVLGRLEIWTEQGKVQLPGVRPQRLLAALLLTPNSVVSIPKLIEVIWEDEPPVTAVKQVQNCVSAMRERLGDADRRLLITDGSGYRVNVGEDQLDSLRFINGIAAARRCAAEGALGQSVRAARSALSLWRGPVFDGLDGTKLASLATRLTDQRVSALELYFDWLLELGDHREVVHELADIIHDHPLHERLHAQLMFALDRCGRQADALGVFHRLKARLAEELGVAPGAGARRVHEQILRGGSRPDSPALGVPRCAAARQRPRSITTRPGLAAPPVPRQLPQSIRDFAGRAEHLAALDAMLPSNSGEQGGQAVVISALDGSGGIGKTTLAVHWAHRVQHRFPDGTLHTNLRGYGPGRPASPDEVLDDFLVALGVPPAAVPPGTGARSGLFRTLLAGRRLLIVVDNANSAEQVRPLLPGTPGCMVLVTSRDSLTGLVVTEAAHRLTLDVLSQPEALSLVVSIIGSARADAEPAAVEELIRLCAGLPLALRIAGGRVAAHQHVSVADIVAELADEDSRLDALTWGQDPRAAVRKVLDWSYEQLPPQEAFVFRRLGLHPGPDLSPPAAAALARRTPHETRLLLDALADAHLIELVAGGRYRFHDLLRAYAAEKARDHDSSTDRHQALDALLAWYSHTAHLADRRLYPASTRLVTELPEPDHPHPIADRDQAWSWFTAERANLVAALRHAVDHGMDQHAVHLVDAFGFLILMGGWEERIETADVGLTAARRIGDPAHEANVLLARGEALVHLHRSEAEADLARAVALAAEVDNIHLQVASLNELGRLLRDQGRYAEALHHLDNALALSRGLDTGRWEAVVEGMIAGVHADLDHHQQVIDHAERSAELRRRIGDSDGEACALAVLAQGWQGIDDHETAIVHSRRAIALGRESLGSQDETLAWPLTILATSLNHLGHVNDAIACWQEAAAIYAERGLDAEAATVHDHIRTARVHGNGLRGLRVLRGARSTRGTPSR
jgi:DNA-binding SARP family transcriptional activator/tetratricopeptide (TPR) repeat protein